MKNRYKITFSYDGTNYFGYAKQVNEVSIQGEIERCLCCILNENITIYASGRTDKGVHALKQVADFETSKTINDKNKFLYSLNKMINKDIYVKSINKVSSNFSSRLDVKEKTYLYLINIGDYNPLKRNFELYENRIINYPLMVEASKIFVGKHDFKNFTSKDEDQDDFIREIFKIELKKNSKNISIKFSGNGFMRYEIRKIVGVLLEVGKNKLTINDVKKLFDTKEREIVNYQAEPHGLYLYDVKYFKK